MEEDPTQQSLMKRDLEDGNSKTKSLMDEGGSVNNRTVVRTVDGPEGLIQGGDLTAYRDQNRSLRAGGTGRDLVRPKHIEEFKFHMTPCGHVFHESCLRIWEEKNRTCPMCRAKINYRASEEV